MQQRHFAPLNVIFLFRRQRQRRERERENSLPRGAAAGSRPIFTSSPSVVSLSLCFSLNTTTEDSRRFRRCIDLFPPMTPPAATSTMPQSTGPPQNAAATAEGAAQAQGQAPAAQGAPASEEPAQTFGIKEVRRRMKEVKLMQSPEPYRSPDPPKKTQRHQPKKKTYRPTLRPASPTPAPSAGQTLRRQSAEAVVEEEEGEQEA